MLRVREHGLQELGVVGAVHVGGDRRLELEVLAPAGDAAAGLADVEGLGVVRLEPRVVALGALALLRGPSETARSCRDVDAANSSTLVTWFGSGRSKVSLVRQVQGTVTHSGRGDLVGSPKPAHSPCCAAPRSSPNFRVPTKPGGRSRDASKNQAPAEAEQSPESARAHWQ